MIAHLKRHGIAANCRRVDTERTSVAEKLLNVAQNLKANLLVMGANGHPPLQEFLLGGSTDDMMRRTEIPILVSH